MLRSLLPLSVLLPLLALPALAACSQSPQQLADGPDPIVALGSSAVSQRYTVPFWAKEAHGASVLWQRARDFCAERDQAAYPNCHAVRIVTFWETPPPFPRLPEHSLGVLLEEASPPSSILPDPPVGPPPPGPPPAWSTRAAPGSR